MRVGNQPLMREKSHLDDMRAAIRGDFERLEERRGAQELMRLTETSQPAAGRVEDTEPDPVPEPAPDPVPEPAPAPRLDEAAGGRRSRLARLFGR